MRYIWDNVSEVCTIQTFFKTLLRGHLYPWYYTLMQNAFLGNPKIILNLIRSKHSGDLFVPNRKFLQIKINFAMEKDHQLDIFKPGSTQLLTCFLPLLELKSSNLCVPWYLYISNWDTQYDTKNQLFCTISHTGYKQTTQMYLMMNVTKGYRSPLHRYQHFTKAHHHGNVTKGHASDSLP